MKKVMDFEQYSKLFEEGDGGGTGAAGSGDATGGAAGVNLGNIGGMGAVAPPVPSAIPGQSWTNTSADYAMGEAGGIGSGDLPAYDTGKSFKKLKGKKSKSKTTGKKPVDKTNGKLKKVNRRGETNTYKWDKGYQSMYVTSFADWTGAYKNQTVK